MKNLAVILFISGINLISSVSYSKNQKEQGHLILGGYGDLHFNSGLKGQNSYADLHRIVTMLGYKFNKALTFISEIEIEHGFVNADSGAYLMVEQAFLNIKYNDSIKLRIGRYLAPLGIINKHHEPTTFNGVERPMFAKYLIPTTWSLDGLELYGKAGKWLSWEFGIATGLDGSTFNGISGIREGRVKERPGFNPPSYTGRIQTTPFKNYQSQFYRIQFGTSFFYGKINNGNKGNDNELNGDLLMLSADLSYLDKFAELKGVIAWTNIDDNENLPPEIAQNMLGYYLEGVLILPVRYAKMLGSHKIKFFTRYEYINTQFKMFDNNPEDSKGERYVITSGLGWYLKNNVVLKTDYSLINYKDGTAEHLINFGVGFKF